MDEEYLTVGEVAALLKLNQQTVRNWIDRGDLPAVRVGARRVRVKQSDLAAYLDAGYTGESVETGSRDPIGVLKVKAELAEGLERAHRELARGAEGELVARGAEGELAEALRDLAAAAQHLAQVVSSS